MWTSQGSLQGPQGLTGLTGAQGPIGLTGLTGLTGATGAEGPIGLTGLTGAQGPIGLTGLTGAVGAVGAAGATGAAGAAGADGVGGILGGAGAFGGVSVSLGLGGGTISVPFTTQSPIFGTLQAVTSGGNVTGFKATAAGTYRVTYRLNVPLSLLGGGVQVYVGGNPVGPTNAPLASVGTTLFDTLLVSANANDVIEIRYSGGALAGLSVNTSSSFEVERVN
ncbi:MAG: hypothetical protein JWM34_4954 [Ilumatobacteraceae bacterium]|nr:hypothetical protein [Ilumatobacteraceae bacterium]